MNRLEEMEILAKEMPKFSPAAWFEPELDQLVFHLEDAPYKEVRVGNLLTVFRKMNGNGEFNGFKIKSFKWLLERARLQGKIGEDGFVSLIDILDMAWIIEAAKILNDRGNAARSTATDEDDAYNRAKQIAEGQTLDSNNISIAA